MVKNFKTESKALKQVWTFWVGLCPHTGHTRAALGVKGVWLSTGDSRLDSDVFRLRLNLVT